MLHLALFGPPALTDSVRELSATAGQRKPLALLALLAWAGEKGLTRDSLVGYLWPELDEVHAKGALKQVLYALRRDVAAELVTGTYLLRLNRALCRCDLWEYQQAVSEQRWRDAEALCLRPFLDGFYLSEAEAFESWRESERASLEAGLRRGLSRRAPEVLPTVERLPVTKPSVPTVTRRRPRRQRVGILSVLALGLVTTHQPRATHASPAASSLTQMQRPERTYSDSVPDFGKARLVVRVSNLRTRGDTLATTVLLSNPGEELLRLGAASMVLGTDSAGARYNDRGPMIGESVGVELPDLDPGRTTQVVLARGFRASSMVLARLRCGDPLYYQVSLRLFDRNLRPRTVALTIGTLRREKQGAFLRSYGFRYFMEGNRVELESRGFSPPGASPKYFGEMTRRMNALALDSSAVRCVASARGGA